MVRSLPLLCLVGLSQVTGFVSTFIEISRKTTRLFDHPEIVEVCGGKDCRRSGGGARLEKQLQSVVDENNLSTTIVGCDCQGECGYGPNLVIEGKIINSVRGQQAIEQALGIESTAEVSEEA